MKSVRIVALVGALAATGSGAAAQDWGGFYGGFALGSNLNGEFRRYEGGQLDVTAGYDTGMAGGVFAGYGYQNGNMVYGAELALSRLDVPLMSEPEIGLTQFADLKMRVGYATGKALLYGVIGYSRGEISSNTIDVALDGLNYGLGVDYAINERVFVGAEFLMRDVAGTRYDEMFDTTYEFQSDTGTLSLRVGMTF
jgi:opacity protein-like surface antigen